jgi:hypothetical protein
VALDEPSSQYRGSHHPAVLSHASHGFRRPLGVTLNRHEKALPETRERLTFERVEGSATCGELLV